MIAIHTSGHRYADQWQIYLNQQAIDYLSIDIFATDIISQIRTQNISKVLFDVTLYDNKTRLAALSIVRSIEALGVDVFPGSAEFWHFDDKIAQKYLFESLGIPHCPTTIFYERSAARVWVENATFPKIFKLRCGAGSSNVIMVKSSKHANRLVDQMFSKGMRSAPTLLADFSTKVSNHKKRRDLVAAFKRLPSTVRNVYNVHKTAPREQGYVYFQEFMPGNLFDTRVIIIGERAFAFRRMVRKDDFRASGSGSIDYDIQAIDQKFIALAFEAADRIGSRCMAFDLIYDQDGAPVIIECCYGFVPSAVFDCPGYWDRSMQFHVGHFYPEVMMLEDFLISSKSGS